ncbi:hypothetical protein C7974DRAFT_44657 [Boeremia exigua]|uniref:uncharacterized protein n=1 Tax=Boeremia exigua TaxID=749465 RepID=UPI001E8CEE1A|nr:uncharacterized protein C7974DRAFT_44657 [Boeremia exigua]KAH6616435.1 hypothetical protein C7974DRAFT_44657 [Boeremia exigua]
MSQTTHNTNHPTMADTNFTAPYERTPTPPPKRRKTVGQCPTCAASFSSRHELRAHMADPALHAPAEDSDAVSFGELSEGWGSGDEFSSDRSFHDKSSYEHTTKASGIVPEPTLEGDGFEFATADESTFSSTGFGEPTLHSDGFEFAPAEEFANAEPPSPDVPAEHAEQASSPTVSDDTQPTPIETPPSRPHVPKGGALGVLYCGTCDKGFGNEKVFRRHFMFGAKHAVEPEDVRDLYWRIWGQSWGEEVREKEGQVKVEEVEVVDVDAMDM